MQSDRKQGTDWRAIILIGDLIAVGFSFPLAFLFAGGPGSAAGNPGFAACIVHGALMLYFFRRAGVYSWSSFYSPATALLPLIGAISLASIFSLGLMSIFTSTGASPTWVWHYASCCFVSIGLVRYGIRRVLTRLPVIRVERTAYFGGGPKMARVLRHKAKEVRKYLEIVGCFDRFKQEGELDALGNRRLGTLADVKIKLESEKITHLIIDQSYLTHDELQSVMEICHNLFVAIRIIPNVFEVWTTRVDLRVVAGVPIFGIFVLPLQHVYNRWLKRAMDILGAVVGLLISAPIVGVLAILIKRESPGPIFYSQERMGLGEQTFKIYKLRSMHLNAEEAGARWAVEDDPRRLKIGSFMREWNLDELPQFWNVLKGEMSLVGPRPERPEFVSGFKETVKYYTLRHSCRPGMSGWAAVHGLRGNTSLEDRLDFDLYYIENWSVWLDVKIMLLTFVPPRNAY